MSFHIIHEDSAVFIVVKPRYCHTVSISTNNDSFCHALFQSYPHLANVQGHRAGEGGLLQRLDYDTEGLLLFAKSAAVFHDLVAQAKAGRLKKGYVAVCEPLAGAYFAPSGYELPGWSPWLGGQVEVACRFVYEQKGRKTVRLRPVDTPSLKASAVYKTRIAITPHDGKCEVFCTLSQGFKHQVRATLAAVGLPICGDTLYHPQPTGPFTFWAVSIEFIHPLTHTTQKCTWQPPTT